MNLHTLFIVAALFFGVAENALGSVPILRSADLTSSVDLYRLVIIFPGHGQKQWAFDDQLNQWNSSSVLKPMEHRSVHVFQVLDPKVIAALRKKMAPTESGFRVWVIGIRGLLVLSTDRDLEPREIFDLIDGLPRRVDEIRLHNDWDAGSQIG